MNLSLEGMRNSEQVAVGFLLCFIMFFGEDSSLTMRGIAFFVISLLRFSGVGCAVQHVGAVQVAPR